MGSRVSTMLAWLGATVALAIAAMAVTSPTARRQVASRAQELSELLNRSIKDIQTRMKPRFGRQMAALEEVSQTMDAATTQFEASMVVSKVRSALASDPRLRGRNVGVRMIGGILHLEGEVRAPEEKALASEIARRASGAELVANDLRVAAVAG